MSLGRRPDRSRGCRSLGVAVSGDVPTLDLEITRLGQVSCWCITPCRVSRTFLPHNLPPDRDCCHERNCPSSSETCVPGYPKSPTVAKWLRAREGPAAPLAFYAQCDLPLWCPRKPGLGFISRSPTCRATPMSPVLLTSLRVEPPKLPSLSSLL